MCDNDILKDIRCQVGYNMDEDLKKDIRKIKNSCISLVNNGEIFLFGSIAKGRYKDNSDIDILILVNEEKDLKELRILRHTLEDRVEQLKLSHNADIKVYSKKRYIELSRTISFEQAIIKDLIDIKEW